MNLYRLKSYIILGDKMRVRYRDVDVDYLGRIMRAEAVGEGVLGMKLVGNVVVNRVVYSCQPFKKSTRSIRPSCRRISLRERRSNCLLRRRLQRSGNWRWIASSSGGEIRRRARFISRIRERESPAKRIGTAFWRDVSETIVSTIRRIFAICKRLRAFFSLSFDPKSFALRRETCYSSRCVRE